MPLVLYRTAVLRCYESPALLQGCYFFHQNLFFLFKFFSKLRNVTNCTRFPESFDEKLSHDLELKRF